MNTEEFITKARAVHGDRYDYSKVKYVNAKTKVNLICKDHGEFEQLHSSHLKGHGCSKCNLSNSANALKFSLKQFVDKARKVHGDRYNYDKVVYKTARGKVTITCLTHGDFAQIAFNHTKGSGCPKCKTEKAVAAGSSDIREFIEKAEKIHGNKYDYTSVEYKKAILPVNILCPDHGHFKQSPNSHLRGSGCPVCGRIRGALNTKKTTSKFIEESKEIHSNKYDYSLTEYKGYLDKVKIICPVHGVFEQTPDKHVRGCGCQACGGHLSTGENEIADFLTNFTTVATRDRRILSGKELDIFLPEYNLAIEYNGSYWHSEVFSKDPKWHLWNKQQVCQKMGIRLIHVSDREDLTIVKKTLGHILGVDSEKLYARKCKIVQGSSNDLVFKKFFNHNHLQGNAPQCKAFGLTFRSSLVAAMAFSKPSSERGNTSEGRWELKRFASCCRTSGGASRLLTAFIRNNSCKSIVSYSDNNWFTGNMYKRLGFEYIHDTGPDYKYTKGRITLHKTKFSHRSMATRKDLDYNPKETEVQNAHRNGWYRIWDCGKKKWELTL